GLYGASVGLGALVPGGLGGQLWDRLGPGATFGYGAPCAIVGTIALAVMVPSRREASSYRIARTAGRGLSWPSDPTVAFTYFAYHGLLQSAEWLPQQPPSSVRPDLPPSPVGTTR